eukprot:3425783-Karenia_brevis.AAC.1
MYWDGHRKCIAIEIEGVLGWKSKMCWHGPGKCIGRKGLGPGLIPGEGGNPSGRIVRAVKVEKV